MPLVTVTELAPGGAAVAHLEHQGERRAVFVRGGCPGDTLDVDIDWSTRPARGRLVGVRAASADRAAPPCPYAERCGGCDWMHVSRAAQLAAHVAHVRAALPASARGLEVRAHPAPRALAYRDRARLHAHVAGGRAVVGPHEPRTRRPLDVERCAVLAPALDAARERVAALLEGLHGTAEVSLALGACEHEPRLACASVSLSDAASDPPASLFAGAERAVREGALAGVRVLSPRTTRPAVVGDPTPWTVAADGRPLRGAADGFAQSNPDVNALLGQRVAELAGDDSNKLVELYAGAGNLTVMLARRAGPVISVEAQASSCAAARANLDARDLRARVTEADASAWTPSRSAPVVVLDPPRAGARAVSSRLAAGPSKRIVYVSCDTQTLARDLTILCAGPWVVRTVDALEMFPHTSHVETIVALDRIRGGT